MVSGADFIAEVVTIPGVGGANHVLTGSIEGLYGDYRGDSPAAILEIDFMILGSANELEILFHRKYREEVTFPKGSAAALVAGWNTGLARILQRLEDDLREIDFS